MKILVTGGAGYIGSHTCVELLNAGHDLIVVDNFLNSKEEALKRVKKITGKEFRVYRADLLDVENLNEIFLENHIDAVIHFAGLKSVGESTVMPLWYYHNNITGTINLCSVMKRNQVKKLVFSSSATVYGVPEKFPISEDFPLSAMNPYGRSKLIIEEILRDLYHSDPSWSISLLRYFNPIGAHESGLIGEDPNGQPNNLMPFISQVAIGKLKQLSVFGGNYPTIDGTGVRDYIHVVDLALGHLRALEQLDQCGIEAYNLGTGNGYSVLEMIMAFEQASGIRINYKVVAPRTGDVPICYADTSKAEKSLKWKAQKGIKEMCEDSWRWQYNNSNGYEINSIDQLEKPRIEIKNEVFLSPKL